MVLENVEITHNVQLGSDPRKFHNGTQSLDLLKGDKWVQWLTYKRFEDVQSWEGHWTSLGFKEKLDA